MSMLVCSSCGAPNPQTRVNCYKCGSALPVNPAVGSTPFSAQSASVKPHRGALILTLGILALLLCAPLGIAAWVMGYNDLNEMKSGQMDSSGYTTTQIGMVCGIIGTVLMALAFLVIMMGGLLL